MTAEKYGPSRSVEKAEKPSLFDTLPMERVQKTLPPPPVQPRKAAVQKTPRLSPVQPRKETVQTMPQVSPFQLPKKHVDYLEVIAGTPFMAVTERDKAHGISSSVGSSMRKELANQGLIKIHRIETGARGKRYAAIETTDAGYSLFLASRRSTSRA